MARWRAARTLGIFSSGNREAKAKREWSSMATWRDSTPAPGLRWERFAGGADAGLVKAAKLFNIKMKELTRSGAFVTDDWGLGRVEGSQAVEAMTLENAGKGSFGDGKHHKDLRVGTAL